MTTILSNTTANPVASVGSTPSVSTVIQIDLNVRVRGNETFAGFEDAEGPLAVGEPVQVVEPESRLTGPGRITEIDPVKGLVYLSVDWSELREGDPPPISSGPPVGVIFAMRADHAGCRLTARWTADFAWHKHLVPGLISVDDLHRPPFAPRPGPDSGGGTD